MSVRVVFALVAGAISVAAPAAAHPGPLDPVGGHICRPEGGGVSDCTSVGLEPGEYHCMQEPCTSMLAKEQDVWCDFGLVYPVRSNRPRGDKPTTAHRGPDRVERVGLGHVLRVERGITVQGPGDCRPSAPAFVNASGVFAPIETPRAPGGARTAFAAWLAACASMAAAAAAYRWHLGQK